MEDFNEEYYVMDQDGADNHPLLDWGETSSRPFLVAKEIDMENLDYPIEIEFNTPYPNKPEMADNLHLMFKCVLSEKIKLLFEKLLIPKVQFIPIIIVTNKKQKIDGHYIFHCWNNICAIDKDNYEGGEIDEEGLITDLQKFCLDHNALINIELDKRLVFCLSENPDFIIVHETIKNAIDKDHAKGFSFYKISEWDDSVMF